MPQDGNDRQNKETTKPAAEVARLMGEVADLNNKYLRALADYQNLARQTENWKGDFVQYANVGLIQKFLEILDDLEKTQETLSDPGLELVIAKFRKLLDSEGVLEIGLVGEQYDPATSEVIQVEPGEKDNVIARVLQKGYKLKDKIIRPGKVVVYTNNKQI